MKFTLQILTCALLAGGVDYYFVRRSTPPEKTAAEVIQRGEYLARLGGCADCHTPKTMGDHGPIDDVTRRLAGHPEDVILPPPDQDSASPWGAATAGMTAWSGPWGVSYAANLTPDRETGLGGWTEETFIKAMRTGKHKGTGRPILPPMPWQPLAEAKTEDLKAIHAYLQSLPPVRNRVPEPHPHAPKTALR